MNQTKAHFFSISLQAIYWMVFCSIHSYAAVFLSSLGFTSTNIGLVIAVSSLISVFVQPIVGSWIDQNNKERLKKSSVFIVTMAFIASISLLFILSSLSIALLFYMLALIFTITLQPLFSALILQLKEKQDNVSFGVSRAFGSLAFAGASAFIGSTVEKSTASVIPYITAVLLFVLFLIVSNFPAVKAHNPAQVTAHDQIGADPFDIPEKFIKRVKRQYPTFLWIIFGLSFIFIFHSMANVFLVKIVQAVGGTQRQFGFALSLMAMVEIPVMMGSGILIRRFGTRKLFAFSMMFYVIRSIALLIAGNMVAIYFAQLLQALSFALYIPISVAYIGEIMAKYDLVKGQTLVVSATTLGSVTGSLLGGIVIDRFGVPQMLIIGVVSTVMGASFVLMGLKKGQV
jgi:PPP family 3-phenylpropionic acid transporter